MQKIIINQNDSGQRLNKFVEKTFPNFPKSAIYKAIRTKKIKINGKRCLPNSILNLYDIFEIYGFSKFVQIKKNENNLKNSLKVKSKNLLNIIYEDENLIIVNKPSGLISHPKTLNQDSLIYRIWNYLEQDKSLNLKNENSFMPALCNRLDTNTSGLIVAAKNFCALKCFNELLKCRKIIKIYCCLAEGVFVKKSDVLINKLQKNKIKNKVFIFNENCNKNNLKKAILKYSVLEQFKNYARLEIKLHTGRSHQIRAQLSFIGHPIIGDYKYGSKIRTKMKLCSNGLFFKTKGTFFDYLNAKQIKISPNFV